MAVGLRLRRGGGGTSSTAAAAAPEQQRVDVAQVLETAFPRDRIPKHKLKPQHALWLLYVPLGLIAVAVRFGLLAFYFAIGVPLLFPLGILPSHGLWWYITWGCTSRYRVRGEARARGRAKSNGVRASAAAAALVARGARRLFVAPPPQQLTKLSLFDRAQTPPPAFIFLNQNKKRCAMCATTSGASATRPPTWSRARLTTSSA
jgi:hypothetical protein